MTNLSQPKTEIIENAEPVTIEDEAPVNTADTFAEVRADVKALYDVNRTGFVGESIF